MFLNGSLENFSVADILQLLSFSRQSGALYVQGAVDAVLYLEDGDAYFARRDSDSPLGDILFAHGVDESDWSGAVAESASRDAVGETLVTRGAIDGDLLAYVVHRQLTDTLFDLFRMPRRGTFDFRVGERHEIGAVRRYKVDALIDDTRHRVEEWATISEFISSPSAMVSVATELPAESVELTLDRRQWDLLLLAAREDRSTLTEMAHALERTDAEVAGALDGLIRAGLVTILEMQSPAFEGAPAAPESHEPAPDRPEPPVDEAGWVDPNEGVQDSVSPWVEADQLEGKDAVAEAETRGSDALDHSAAPDDPPSSEWFETEIGSWQDATSAGDGGDEIGSWPSAPVPEDSEDEIGGRQGSPAREGAGDEIASWQEPGPLFEDVGPDAGGEGAEEAESWWGEAPAGAPSSAEWETTWSPTDSDADARTTPEWFAAPEESPEEGDLGDSIWGDVSESPTEPEDAGADAASLWDAPAAGDISWEDPEDRQSDSLWTPDAQDDERMGNVAPEISPEPPPAPVAEAPAPEAEARTSEPPDAPGEAQPPAADSGEPSDAPETSDSESSGFRTVALQELRNLAGVAGTPVRLPGSRRPATGGDAGSHPSPAPKIRALKRLIAAVRGL